LDPALVAQAVQGPASARLNQRLLLAAYPKDLSKYHERFYVLDLVPMSNPGANRVSGLGYVVNTNLDAAAMAEHMKTTITALGPAKAFLIGFHVAIYAGLAMASPFVFFFIGQFVLPALRIREKKYLYRGLGFAIPLFVGGVCFCYFILLPAALAASQLYSNWFGFSSNIWDAGDYIGFVCKFMLGMGLGFELPVVLLVLVKIGLLSYSTLAKARPYMIVINLILGAVLTTPEVFTQILMAIPLQVLFEISVWIAWYWERQERKREAAANRAGN
jgi:sec-independent protein translocase protein TatC